MANVSKRMGKDATDRKAYTMRAGAVAAAQGLLVHFTGSSSQKLGRSGLMFKERVEVGPWMFGFYVTTEGLKASVAAEFEASLKALLPKAEIIRHRQTTHLPRHIVVNVSQYVW